MERIIRLTERDLTRIVRRVITEGTDTLEYTNPMKAEISKYTVGGKHNIIAIKTNNVTRKYKIIGTNPFGKDFNLSFQDLVKKPNGDLIFNRYVDKTKKNPSGIDPQIISFKDVSDIIRQSSKNVSDINPDIDGPNLLHFIKIS